MKKLESVHNRRKAFVYVSNGYDFNPFSETRKQNDQELNRQMTGGNSADRRTAATRATMRATRTRSCSRATSSALRTSPSELSELTREANRANATIYTIDPRGLVGMPDLDQKVDMMDFQNYVTTSQNSLRVLAEQTGGFATINQNDFVEGAQADRRGDERLLRAWLLLVQSRSDAAQRRKVEVKVNRPNVDLRYRTEYTLQADQGAGGEEDVDGAAQEPADRSAVAAERK